MQWSSDRAGFPVVELPEIGLAVHLLPVAKCQFERFLWEPVVQSAEADQAALYGDAWYAELLDALPRVALGHAQPDTLESLFLGGIRPTEVVGFARWLGPGYDLPRVDDWRCVDKALNALAFDKAAAEALRSDERLSRQARGVLADVIAIRQPTTWGELALLHGGLLEWVTIGPHNHGGLGRPRPVFQRLLLNPQRDNPVRPIRPDRRRDFGFRLIRRL